MGLRIRKRVRLSKSTHLNVGSRRASVSVGKPGLTVNVSRRGARATIGIPGTGVSYVTKQVGGSRKRGSIVEELFVAIVIVLILGTIKLVVRGVLSLVSGAKHQDQLVPPLHNLLSPSDASTPVPLAASHEQPQPAGAAQIEAENARRPQIASGALLLVAGAIVLVVLVVGVALNQQSHNVSASRPNSAPPGGETVRMVANPRIDNPQLDMSAIPALLPNEVPPPDMPNYFDDTELGSATLEVVSACAELTPKGRPDIRDDMRARFCLCYADAARVNFRNRRTIAVTKDQDAACLKFSRTHGEVTPYGKALPSSTSGIVAAMMDCLQKIPSSTSPRYGARGCACTIDAITKKHSPEQHDIDRCAVAARYGEAKGVNLTVRQFNGL